MANFALSSTSVRSLKNALQDRYPSVKSAHLSEAIAATVGFRTHAALLAYIKSTTAVPIVFLDDKRKRQFIPLLASVTSPCHHWPTELRL